MEEFWAWFDAREWTAMWAGFFGGVVWGWFSSWVAKRKNRKRSK